MKRDHAKRLDGIKRRLDETINVRLVRENDDGTTTLVKAFTIRPRKPEKEPRLSETVMPTEQAGR